MIVIVVFAVAAALDATTNTHCCDYPWRAAAANVVPFSINHLLRSGSTLLWIYFDLFDELYELYNTVKHRASMYHIDGNTSLAKKCMIEAEIIFDELKKYQQLYQEAWDKMIPLGYYHTPPNPPLFVYPNGSYLKGGKRKTRKK